jgi:hypothetical protein
VAANDDGMQSTKGVAAKNNAAKSNKFSLTVELESPESDADADGKSGAKKTNTEAAK